VEIQTREFEATKPPIRHHYKHRRHHHTKDAAGVKPFFCITVYEKGQMLNNLELPVTIKGEKSTQLKAVAELWVF